MAGLDLLSHLKADPATSTIPVIVVSADATTQQVDAALDAGAVRYLTKPVGVNELLSALDDLLEQVDTGFSCPPPPVARRRRAPLLPGHRQPRSLRLRAP